MAVLLRGKDKGELSMDKKHRKLLSAIAREAHIMGRIYAGLGEKENPSEVLDLIERMIEDKLEYYCEE